jgi:hypothetical protein
MKIIPDRSLIQNVMLMSTHVPQKISKGGPKYGSSVGSSPLTRFDPQDSLRLYRAETPSTFLFGNL